MKSLLLALLASLTLLPMTSFALDANGFWTKINYKIKGTWTLTETDGKTVLTLSEDFKTKSAPDLKLFPSPQPISAINNKNALNESLLISPLQKIHESLGRHRPALKEDRPPRPFRASRLKRRGAYFNC